MRVAQSHAGRRRRLAGAAVVAAMLVLPGSAQAGRLIVTGHDAESHCIRETPELQPAACAFVATGVNWIRAGAPDPSKPVLILDRAALDFQKSIDKLNAAGAGVPYQVVEPRSPDFATLPIDTARYSAVLIASSKNAADDPTEQDLDEVGSTPDADAINARKADFARFFSAGGGIFVMSGGAAARADSARYYGYLGITRAGGFVEGAASLTPLGRAIGWQDARAFPGELDEINCCLTHVSFELPAPESALKVAEMDASQHAITMVAQTSNLATIEEAPTTAQAVFAGLPGVPSTATPHATTVTGSKLPICTTRSSVKVSLRRPKGVRFVMLEIYVPGREKKIISGKYLGTKSRTRPVTVKLFKTKATRVRLTVTTASGRRLIYRQTYKPCVKRAAR